jgi:hypothetical protein
MLVGTGGYHKNITIRYFQCFMLGEVSRIIS